LSVFIEKRKVCEPINGFRSQYWQQGGYRNAREQYKPEARKKLKIKDCDADKNSSYTQEPCAVKIARMVL